MSEKIQNEQVMKSIKAEINYIVEEAYQKGLVDGKKPEHKCEDCRHYGNANWNSPCDYCCYNDWESQFEQKADEIEVGDIIRCKDDHSVEAYVTSIDDNMRNFSGFAINEVRNVCSIGGVYYNRPLLHWEKTGKHVSFSNIINKMKDGE